MIGFIVLSILLERGPSRLNASPGERLAPFISNFSRSDHKVSLATGL
jgi:hypothetical protein